MSTTTRLATLVSAAVFTLASAAAMATEDDKVSSVFTCDALTYDERSLSLEEEGIVKLALQIGAGGKVMDAKLLSSSGYANLDKASLNSVQGCSLKSVALNGQETPATPMTWSNVNITWVLK